MHNGDEMMFCPDCDANLDELAEGGPCSECGGFRRSTKVSPETIRSEVMVGEVSLEVTRADVRPWAEKWRTVLHGLERIENAYSHGGGKLSNEEVDGRVNQFFVNCDHLRDWLDSDPLFSGLQA
jgi:hypothetical protein